MLSSVISRFDPRTVISWVSALSALSIDDIDVIDARFCLLLDEDASSDAIRKLEVEIELRRCLS